MFNLYQSINRKGGDEKEEKEPDVIGHERFYQERRSRSSVRKKKKKVTQRAHSAGEFSHGVLEAAKRRAAFCERSQSTEQKNDDGNKTPQRAKVIFCKR